MMQGPPRRSPSHERAMSPADRPHDFGPLDQDTRHHERDEAADGSAVNAAASETRGRSQLGVFTQHPSSHRADADARHRIDLIKTVANHEKATLMTRLEQLAAECAELRTQLSRAHQQVLEYQKSFGTLNDYAGRQMKLHDEVVSLRDTVRHWQDKEQEARAECRELHTVLDTLQRRRTVPSTLEEKLADLQQRLAVAHMQRQDLASEMEDVRRAYATRRAAMQTRAVAAGLMPAGVHTSTTATAEDHITWQLRGKLADLELQTTQRGTRITELQRAADVLEGEICARPAATVAAMEEPLPRVTALPGVAASTPGPKGVMDGADVDAIPIAEMVARALSSREWIKLVHVGTFDITYKHVASGRVVPDLGKELAAEREARKQERLAASSSPATQEVIIVATPAATGGKADVAGMTPLPRTATAHAAMAKDLERLSLKLRAVTDENAKLRMLLDLVARSVVVGSRPPSAATAVPAAAPGPDGASCGASPVPNDATVRAATPNVDARGASVSVTLDGDDESMLATRLRASQEANAVLNSRCAELLTTVAAKDAELGALRSTIQNYERLTALTTASSASMPTPTVGALREELAALRDALLEERNRSLCFEDEIQRLKSRPAAVVRIGAGGTDVAAASYPPAVALMPFGGGSTGAASSSMSASFS